MGKKLTLEEIKELYENESRRILEIERREIGNQGHKTTYIKYECLVDGYVGWQTLNSMSVGSGCYICNANVKLSIDFIKEILKEINPKIKILSDEYINNTTKLKCLCLIDGNTWESTWATLQGGHGCKKCSERNNGKIKSKPNGNSIKEIRPDLLKYLANIEDGDNYAIYSNRKIKVICPECGKEKEKMMTPNRLTNMTSFPCNYCGDGISIPEKFGIHLLKQLEIEFKPQNIFDWSQNKRYDFYIPSLNMIIETHGKQHYEKSVGHYKRTLIEEQSNDLLKYNLAIENVILPENYVIVDARCSEFKWLMENYIKSLENHFDLSRVNWDEIWENCQSSIVAKVWDAWNNRNENDSTVTIGKTFSINKSTIIKYLKRGNEIGKCIYNANEEKKKRSSKYGKMSVKAVYQYKVDGEFSKKFESVSQAEIKTSIRLSNISACCLGKTKTSGGFKWSYNPPINGMYPD